MPLTKKDIITINSKYIRRDKNTVLIAKHTENTWQKNRSFSEKKKDTDQGKKAEAAVLLYLDKDKNITYIPYDDFRCDGFFKYAPFDGIAFSKNTKQKMVETIIKRINNEIKQSTYGDISSDLRKYIFNQGFRCIEIKSTKVNDKKLDEKGNVDFDKILENHFLTYPAFARTGNFSYEEYVFYAKKKLHIKGYLPYETVKRQVIENEKSNSSDIYIHVYMDEANYYIIGYITKEKFFELADIKKLIKPRKSKKALYFVCSLKDGIEMNKIDKEFIR